MSREDQIIEARRLAQQARDLDYTASAAFVGHSVRKLAEAVELLCDALDTTRRIPIARQTIGPKTEQDQESAS